MKMNKNTFLKLFCYLFSTLPNKYDAIIITALETIEDSRLSLNLVKSKLLDEEIKKTTVVN